jgi:NTE family protein
MQDEPGYICYDKPAPSFADVAGHVLDTVFIDSLESDLERLERINRTLNSIPKDLMTQVDLPLKTIDTLVIAPSENLSELASQYAKSLPRATRFFLSRLGVDYQQGNHVLSYVLFEGDYCQRLIDLGYQDAMARKEEINTFLSPTSH